MSSQSTRYLTKLYLKKVVMKVALETVVLTQTTMWEEGRWLTPDTTLRFSMFTADGGDHLYPDGDVEDSVFFLFSESADDIVHPSEPLSLAPPPRPKPSNGGACGPGFELNILGGK